MLIFSHCVFFFKGEQLCGSHQLQIFCSFPLLCADVLPVCGWHLPQIFHYVLDTGKHRTWLIKPLLFIFLTEAAFSDNQDLVIQKLGVIIVCQKGVSANSNAVSTLQTLHIVFLFFASIMFAVSLVVLFGYHCVLVASNRSTLGKYSFN